MIRMKALALVCAAMMVFGAADAFAAKKKKAPKKPKTAVVKITDLPVSTTSDPTLPDLVILPAESDIQAGGCNPDDPLFSGTIAVKNNSKVRADRLVVDPLTAGYLPETLDIKDEDIVPNSLAPKEILSTDVLAGKGREKVNRGFNGKRTVYYVVDPYNKVKEGNETNNLLKMEVTLSCK